MDDKARIRNWCFTINNPTEYCYECVKEVALSARYLLFANEIGKECGTPHIQGYVELKEGKTRNAIRKCLGDRASMRKARGSGLQNLSYISKDGDYYEFGEMKRQGKRNDLAKVKTLIKDGNNMRGVVDGCTSYQQMMVAKELLKYYEEKRRWKTQVLWFCGPTGTGKTRAAYREFDNDCYDGCKTLKWWDGYDGHANVLFDDFRATWCDFDYLLRVLDRYPVRIENKGGSRQLLAKKIIVTCPYSPKQLYSGIDEEDICQLLRRIDEVRVFGV